MAWARSAASLSSSEFVAGSHADMLNAVPTRAEGRTAFSARNPAPCARFTTCVARRKSSRLLRPGACVPSWYPRLDERGRLVEQHPVRDAIAQRLRGQLHVVGEARGSITIRPSPGIFQRLRQVPVIERDKRPDVRLEQRVNESAVVVDPFGIHRAGARRLNARPGKRETVAIQIHRAHQRDIFAAAMIRIARHITRVAVLDLARSVREAIPDGLALAVFFPRTFNLVRRGRRAPEKSLRKGDLGRWGEILRWRGGGSHRAGFGRSRAPREQRGQASGGASP